MYRKKKSEKYGLSQLIVNLLKKKKEFILFPPQDRDFKNKAKERLNCQLM